MRKVEKTIIFKKLPENFQVKKTLPVRHWVSGSTRDLVWKETTSTKRVKYALKEKL